MIRRLIGRLGMIYHPWWIIPAMIAGYLFVESPYAWFLWWKRLPIEQARDLALMRDGVMLTGVCLYGGFRVASYHPLYWTEYGRWLARTPWSVSRPLPLGPIPLALRDVVVVGAVMAGMHDSYVSIVYVPLLFLIGYLATLGVAFFRTGASEFAFVLAFGIGLAVRFWISPGWALAVCAANYPLALIGLRRSLAKFPWARAELLNLGPSRTNSQRRPDVLVALTAFGKLGWPFDIMAPSQSASGISYRDGTLISLLVGWWTYATVANIEAAAGEIRMLLSTIGSSIICSVAVVRLMRYCANYRPPINLWGRLLTLRWIVPGYDKAFVAPLSSIAIFAVAAESINVLDLDPRISIPIAISLSLLILLNVGPSLVAWRHTGAHRIVPTTSVQSFVQL